MHQPATPSVEQPNLRAPIALIVDDPAPCINPLWYYRHQVDGEAEPAHERDIPLAFMQRWCDWVRASGIRGDFTVLPYPAGLGRIDDRLEGYDTGEVRAWLALAREVVAPQFDIHCEVLTHTNALDLATWQLRPQSEQGWMDVQDEATLTEYFATAMQILGEAGLPNHGITQPVTFLGDQAVYARAILAAEKRVNGSKVSHYFLHFDAVSDVVPQRVTLLDEAAGEAIVSIWAGTNDYLWHTHSHGSMETRMTPETLANRYLTTDGHSGRLAALVRGGGPIVVVTHWQTLYSNGLELGLKTFKEVMARFDTLHGDRFAWRKLSEITDHLLVARTVRFESTTTQHEVEVIATAPFGTDILTVSIPMPWMLDKNLPVRLNAQTLPFVSRASDLEAGKCLRRGSLITVSLPLAANEPARITITDGTA